MFLGRKEGMTRIFTPAGESIPVTVLSIQPHQVVYLKTQERDGYSAYQVATEACQKKQSSLTLAERGHLRAHQIDRDYKSIFEIAAEDFASEMSSGDIFDLSLLQSVSYVDVTGVTKGKGFSGVVKRWGFKTQPASHGNSLSGRVPGSLGSNQDPGRVWKNKKMPGRDGGHHVTVQNLEVVRVDVERGLLLVRGAIPGATGFRVWVRRSFKKPSGGQS